MVPDDAPDVGVQPEPQFVPPHVRVKATLAPTAAESLPAAQSVQTEAPAPEYLPAAQAVQTEAPAPEYVATNPDLVALPSEVKSTCKYPVDDVYTLPELTEPDSRAICSVEPHDDDVQRLMVT